MPVLNSSPYELVKTGLLSLCVTGLSLNIPDFLMNLCNVKQLTLPLITLQVVLPVGHNFYPCCLGLTVIYAHSFPALLHSERSCLCVCVCVFVCAVCEHEEKKWTTQTIRQRERDVRHSSLVLVFYGRPRWSVASPFHQWDSHTDTQTQ